MGDLEETDWGVLRDKFPKYLRRIEERLNSESVEKQFGRADVYDSTGNPPPQSDSRLERKR